MRPPHDDLLLRCAPPDNAAGTPILTTIFHSKRSDNAVAPQHHTLLHHCTTTHDRRHP